MEWLTSEVTIYLVVIVILVIVGIRGLQSKIKRIPLLDYTISLIILIFARKYYYVKISPFVSKMLGIICMTVALGLLFTVISG